MVMPRTGDRRSAYWRFIFGRFVVSLWLATVLGGAFVLWTAAPSKRPLVAKGDWLTDGVFADNWRPPTVEVSSVVVNNPESRFFTSWSPAGPVAGTVRSRPFIAPAYIAVPYAGYPDEPGNGLWLECVGSHRRVPVSRGNAHEVWVERTVRLGPDWCRSLVQLVATSSSKSHWIAVGTPYATSAHSWLKESVFVLTVVHLLAWTLLVGPGFLVASLLRVRTTENTLVLAIVVTLALGYVQFFIHYYVPQVAPLLAALAWAASVAGAVILLQSACQRTLSSTIRIPLATTFLLSFFYMGLLYAGDVGTGPWDAAYRFDPAVWSTDNQIPQIVSEALYTNRSLKGLLGDWHVSDRPPLMSGVFLLARPLWQWLLAPGENIRLLFLFYQVTGLVVTSLWVVPVWLLLGTAPIRPRARVVVLLFMATLGPMIFNSTYIWPKMLAGTLTLAGCLVLADTKSVGRAWALASAAGGGALVGLGLMAHSGVVFALPFAALAALARRHTRFVSAALAFTLAAAAIVLPWLIWQRTEDPPGNALTKYAFAGTYGIDQPAVGVVDTVRQAYSRLSFHAWLEMRAEGVRTLISGASPLDVSWVYAREMDAIGRERLDDFMKLGQSLRFANVGWLIFAVCLLRRRPRVDTRLVRACASWALVGLAGVLLNIVVVWSVHITHTQSYLSLLLMAAGLCGVLLVAPRWVRFGILASHGTYVLIVWLWSPLREANVAEGSLIACGLSAGLLITLAMGVEDEELADNPT